MGYTWAQFSGYLRLARRRRARHELHQFVAMTNAFGGGDQAKKLHEQLRAAAEK